MNVVLLQLPVPDHSGTDLPLAAACLENAWLRRVPAAPSAAGEAREVAPAAPVRFHHPPLELVNKGSDPAILDWLVSSSADLVGFSLYLWNQERSRWLAARLRQRLPKVRLLAGGPEVETDRRPGDAIPTSGPVELPEFDWLLAGPGEQAFVDLLASCLRAHFTGISSPAPDYRVPALYRTRREAEAVANPDPAGLHPLLDGCLPLAPDRPVHLESVRGCPNRCSYCHYGKQFNRLLFLPEAQIAAVIESAASAGCRELYLMDPSFSQRPRLDDFLVRLAAWNRQRLAIHTELRLEDITSERARLLAAAGIASVEAGLQSTNPLALAAVGRSWNRPRFEAGAEALRAAGIRISTGVIIGLPEDGPEQIAATIDYVADMGLGANAEAYPLAVLPGTVLRAEAGRLGLKFMQRPPHYLLESPWIDQAGIMAALELARDQWDREGLAPIPPGLPEAWSADSVDSLAALLSRPADLPLAINLRLPASLLTHDETRGALCQVARQWREDSPHSECRLVLDLDDARLPSKNAPWFSAGIEELREAFLAPDHLLERIRYYQSDPQGTWSCRLFVTASTCRQLAAWLGLRGAAAAELVVDLASSPERPALLDRLLAREWDEMPFVHAGATIEPELAAYYDGLENLLETGT